TVRFVQASEEVETSFDRGVVLGVGAVQEVDEVPLLDQQVGERRLMRRVVLVEAGDGLGQQRTTFVGAVGEDRVERPRRRGDLIDLYSGQRPAPGGCQVRSLLLEQHQRL